MFLVNNPIDAESCGSGYQITVKPSSEAIDMFLPIDGYWPGEQKMKGHGYGYGHSIFDLFRR